MLLNNNLLHNNLLHNNLLHSNLLNKLYKVNNSVFCNLCNNTGLLSWKYNNNLFLDTFKQQTTHLYTSCYKCQSSKHRNCKHRNCKHVSSKNQKI